MPGAKQACPKSAAAWSPATPRRGCPAGAPHAVGGEAEAAARRPDLGQGGRRARPSSPASSSLHARRPMSNSIVRLAFDGSVANTAPPVRCHTTQASTVPRARSGPAATPPSVRSHAILVAEKYGSSTSPVRSRTSGRWPAAASSSQRSAVRRSCHTMARCRGRPVRRSQATTVSRWLVTPMAATGTVELGHDAGQRGPHRVGDVVGVVLHPARTGIVLRELLVARPADGARLVEGEGSHAGGAGVDGDHVGHRRMTGRRLAPGDLGLRVGGVGAAGWRAAWAGRRAPRLRASRPWPRRGRPALGGGLGRRWPLLATGTSAGSTRTSPSARPPRRRSTPPATARRRSAPA